MGPQHTLASTTTPALSGDAAFVLALAQHALTFANCPTGEAERWLRILRVHGHAGSVLQSLGVGEAPLGPRQRRVPGSMIRRIGRAGDAVATIERTARAHALSRGAALVSTVDLTVALLEAYGGAIEEVLQLRGTSRDELLERLPPRTIAAA